MDTKQTSNTTDRKAILSTLWIFILMNMIFRDLHELPRPGLLAEVLTGYVNGVQMTDTIFMIGAIMAEIIIIMVLLSRVLEYRFNRPANIIGGAIAILLVLATGPADLDDMFFASIEIAALLYIIWYAWNWSKETISTVSLT